MAGDQKIIGMYSEYSIKDNATKVIQKIEKEDKKLIKTLKLKERETKKEFISNKKNERQLKKNTLETQKYSREVKKAEREQSRFRRTLSRGARSAGHRVSGVAGAASSGGLIGGVGKALGVFGTLFVAGAISIQKSAEAMSQSVQIRKERGFFNAVAQTDPTFGRARETLGGAGFAKSDVRGGLSTLSDAGFSNLTPEAIQVLKDLSQKFGSVTQAARVFTTGEGLGQIAGQRGKEAQTIISNLSTDPLSGEFTAQVRAEILADLLKTEGERFKILQKNMAVYKQVNKEEENLQTFRKDLTLELAGDAKKREKTLKAIKGFEKVQSEITGAVSTGAGKTAEGIRDVVGIEERAVGGPVSSNKPYIVGERGPELFKPKTSGSIVPNNKLKSGGITINNTFNIQGSSNSNTMIQNLKQMASQVFKTEIEKAARELGFI